MFLSGKDLAVILECFGGVQVVEKHALPRGTFA
jgi:hypothetical protein